MKSFNKFRKCVPLVPVLLLVLFGIYLILKQPHVDYVKNFIREGAELKEGKIGYETWMNLDLYFRVWIFHVMNPKDVMEGGFPKLQERGPYVYDLNIKKVVTNTDIERDEINFTVVRTFRFNSKETGNLSENDEVTVLNTAYLGTLTMMANGFAAFLGKFGDPIANLFPDMTDIFTRGRVKDILFDGMPLVCDAENKDLKMICGFLKTKKPPIIKDTDTENVYTYSFFDSLNGTVQGPYTVNRGVKNIASLGNTTSNKGVRISKHWSDKQCNVVSGTDSITWAPMSEKLPFVSAYEGFLCRTFKPSFKKEVIIHGLMGYRYELSADTWNQENISCFCPVKKRVMECLPTGLMDLTKCQEAPIIYSEPHFLHGDEHLTDFARGINMDEELHSTFITIEPFSGAPLSGSKKLQLNMKLINIPVVKLLMNVSEGYFPILWASEENTASVELLDKIIQLHRLINIFRFFSWVPVLLGIFWLFEIFLYTDSRVHSLN